MPDDRTSDSMPFPCHSWLISMTPFKSSCGRLNLGRPMSTYRKSWSSESSHDRLTIFKKALLHLLLLCYPVTEEKAKTVDVRRTSATFTITAT